MASKAKLHWFWRGMVAEVIGVVGCLFICNQVRSGSSLALAQVLLFLPLPGMVAYGILTRHFGPQSSGTETHCHKCGYFLRRLGGRRCPRCGELRRKPTASKAALHWFWRGMVAELIGIVGIVILPPLCAVLVYILAPDQPFTMLALRAVLEPLPGIIAYGILTRNLGPQLSSSEIRCRKCGYILRGLSEPRCPECAEAI